jgi:hypothetical protein
MIKTSKNKYVMVASTDSLITERISPSLSDCRSKGRKAVVAVSSGGIAEGEMTK